MPQWPVGGGPLFFAPWIRILKAPTSSVDLSGPPPIGLGQPMGVAARPMLGPGRWGPMAAFASGIAPDFHTTPAVPNTLGCVVILDGLVTTLVLSDGAVTSLVMVDFECTTNMPGPYTIGNVVRTKATFTDPNNANAAVDPSVVTVSYMAPGGTITSITYPSAGTVRESTGIYHADIPVASWGTWYYDWTATGVGAARLENSFQVLPTQITP